MIFIVVVSNGVPPECFACRGPTRNNAMRTASAGECGFGISGSSLVYVIVEVILLRIEILHDLIYTNCRNYGRIVFMGHAVFLSSTAVGFVCVCVLLWSG